MSNEVVESIFWIFSKWACCDKEFYGVSLTGLVLSWDACTNGGKMKSPVVHSSWFCPPIGLLKMNFDESFNRETSRGVLERS